MMAPGDQPFRTRSELSLARFCRARIHSPVYHLAALVRGLRRKESQPTTVSIYRHSLHVGTLIPS